MSIDGMRSHVYASPWCVQHVAQPTGTGARLSTTPWAPAGSDSMQSAQDDGRFEQPRPERDYDAPRRAGRAGAPPPDAGGAQSMEEEMAAYRQAEAGGRMNEADEMDAYEQQQRGGRGRGRSAGPGGRGQRLSARQQAQAEATARPEWNSEPYVNPSGDDGPDDRDRGGHAPQQRNGFHGGSRQQPQQQEKPIWLANGGRQDQARDPSVRRSMEKSPGRNPSRQFSQDSGAPEPAPQPRSGCTLEACMLDLIDNRNQHSSPAGVLSCGCACRSGSPPVGRNLYAPLAVSAGGPQSMEDEMAAYRNGNMGAGAPPAVRCRAPAVQRGGDHVYANVDITRIRICERTSIFHTHTHVMHSTEHFAVGVAPAEGC
jgi:hypothetical protein